MKPIVNLLPLQCHELNKWLGNKTRSIGKIWKRARVQPCAKLIFHNIWFITGLILFSVIVSLYSLIFCSQKIVCLCTEVIENFTIGQCTAVMNSQFWQWNGYSNLYIDRQLINGMKGRCSLIMSQQSNQLIKLQLWFRSSTSFDSSFGKRQHRWMEECLTVALLLGQRCIQF